MENIFVSKLDARQVVDSRPYDCTPELQQDGEKNEQQDGLPQKQKPRDQEEFIHNGPSLPSFPTRLNAWPGPGSHARRHTNPGTSIQCGGRFCQG